MATKKKQLRRDTYNEEGMLLTDGWVPGRPENEGWGQAWDLGNFGYDPSAGQKNTLAIRATLVKDGARYSVNIGQWNEAGADIYIYLHFNPRRSERSIVMNSKDLGEDGTGSSRPRWGRIRRVTMDQRSPIFHGELELLIQATEEGFNMFYGEGRVHCASFPHRYGMPQAGDALVAHLPDTDDAGAREDWMVHEMWWGSMPLIPVNPSIVQEYGAASEPVEVVVSGLPILSEEDKAEVDEWLKCLEERFAIHGLTELHVERDGTAILEFESPFAAWSVSNKNRTIYEKDKQLSLALKYPEKDPT